MKCRSGRSSRAGTSPGRPPPPRRPTARSTPAPMDTACSVSITVRSSSVALRRTAYPVFLPLHNMVQPGSSSSDGARAPPHPGPPRAGAPYPGRCARQPGCRARGAARASGARARRRGWADAEAGRAARRLLRRQHEAAPVVTVERRPREAPARLRGAREGRALGHETGSREPAPQVAEDEAEAEAGRPHRSVSVRTGIACRSFWNSRYCT